MNNNIPPEINGMLRKFMLKVPEVINNCSGIKIFGKIIRSILFSTDISTIRNSNADAIIAVYPFTPQPIITQAVMLASDKPVFCGVGGGLTQGKRVVNLALHAEFQGAVGVVLNGPSSNNVIQKVSSTIDIPVIVTVLTENDDFEGRIKSGCTIFNVSAAQHTSKTVRIIRNKFPDFPIIATGGPTDESILETINAGANAVTWTPPESGEIFKSIMSAYREGLPHP